MKVLSKIFLLNGPTILHCHRYHFYQAPLMTGLASESSVGIRSPGRGGGVSLWRWHTYSSYGCDGAFKATTTTITTRRLKKKKQQFCKHFCSLLCMTRTSNVLASRLVDLYTRNPFSFSFSELRYIPLGFNSRNILQHLTNWTNDMEY